MTPSRVWAAVAEACAVVQRGRSLRQDHAGAHAQGAQITCFTSTKVQIMTRPLSFMLQSSASFHPLLASLLAMLAKVLTYLLSSTKVQILRCSPRCSITSYNSTNTETRCLAYNSTNTDTPLPRMVPPTACLPACVAREGQKVQIPTLYCYKVQILTRCSKHKKERQVQGAAVLGECRGRQLAGEWPPPYPCNVPGSFVPVKPVK